MIPGLLLVFAVAGDMPPPTPPVAPDESAPLAVRCNGLLCVMPQEVVKNMVDAHNSFVDEVADLKRQLEVLKKSKGCAKLEVVPKQPPPGYKKERDS